MTADRLYVRQDVPFELSEIALSKATDDELVDVSRESGTGLSLDEMRLVRDYFARKGRNPYDVELQSIGQAWSEHCCYKSSKVFLKEYVFGINNRQVMDRGDAGVMEFDREHAYALRVESHNHPSAVEPYGGAATGIGGILRDVLCMGAQPIALVDPLFFGPLDHPPERLHEGVKHPKYLLSGVVAGIRDYGNRVGVPTVSGGIWFDESYVGNCLVNVGCVGIAEKRNIRRNAVRGPGDVLVLVGGRTGRDGIHGVTFASAVLTEESETESRGAVQLGEADQQVPGQPADRVGKEIEHARPADACPAAYLACHRPCPIQCLFHLVNPPRARLRAPFSERTAGAGPGPGYEPAGPAGQTDR